MTEPKAMDSSSASFSEIITVTAQNIETTGFFCYMSKKKSEGYGRKLKWLKDRFNEGMRIDLLSCRNVALSNTFPENMPGAQSMLMASYSSIVFGW